MCRVPWELEAAARRRCDLSWRRTEKQVPPAGGPALGSSGLLERAWRVWGRLHGARCHGAVSSPGRRALNVRLRAFLWEAVGSHQRFINTGVTGADLEAHSGGHE